MNVVDFENLIITALKTAVQDIIEANPTLPIAVKQGERQGDAISKFLENAFVEYTQNHPCFKNTQASSTGNTKSPYDVETFFEYNGHRELVWIDFKAFNIANKDSNPDSGTPNKIIKLIENGSFYLAYVFVFYQGSNSGLSFVQKDDAYVKAYFLKDISKTVRITPANQLQIDYLKPPQYRIREAFLLFLMEKKKQSFIRQLEKAQKSLENLDRGIVLGNITLESLLKENQKQEENIKNL